MASMYDRQRKVSTGLPSIQKLPNTARRARSVPPADTQPASRSDFADQVRVNKVYRWK